MKETAFKIRIENTIDGEVTEISTNCFSLISIGDPEHIEDRDDYKAKIVALRNCTNSAVIALLKALESHQKETEKILFKNFLDMIR